MLGWPRALVELADSVLAVPAVLASGLFELGDVIGSSAGGSEGFAALALAPVVAFGVGYAAIAWLLRYLVTHFVGIFVGYRVLLGAGVLAFVSVGAIS